MRFPALALLLLLTACSAPSTDQPIRRPVNPPVVVVDPPRVATTTAPPALDVFPVDVLTAPAPSQDGMDALGTFTLQYDPDRNCLYHIEEDNNGEPGTGGRMVIQWPFGYSAEHRNGKVIVFDDAGAPVVTAGVQFQIGGGAGEFDGHVIRGGCDAIAIWYAHGDPLPPG